MVNPLEPLPPPPLGSGGGTIYGSYINDLLGSSTEAQKQAIWVTFLTSNNLSLTTPPPTDPTTLNAFITYIDGLENVSGPDPDLPQIPTNGVYQQYFTALFPTATIAFQQALWVNFLTINNLSLGYPPDLDLSTLNSFVTYITGAANITGQVASLPQLPTSGFYANFLSTFYGSLTTSQQQALWVEFLSASNLTAPVAEDIPTIETFLNNMQTFAGFPGIQVPTSGIYGDYMQSFFANLDPVGQQAAWLLFLSSNNLSLVNPPSTSSATVDLFINYADTQDNVTGIDPSLPQVPVTGIYGGYMQQLFAVGSSLFINQPPTIPIPITPAIQQQIWGGFLQSMGITSTDPTNPASFPGTDPATVQKFLLLAVNTLDEVDVLNLANTLDLLQPIPPVSGPYAAFMNAYFGNLGVAQQQQIWIGFLQQNGFSTNPYDPNSIPPTNAATQTLFLNYLQGYLNNLGNASLSQDEVTKRQIMFSVFTELISMLMTIQNTVAETANTLETNALWQEQYTDELADVPTYVGGTSSNLGLPPGSNAQTSVIPTNADLTKFTFGYDNISVADIAQWYATNLTSGNAQQAQQTFSISAFMPYQYYTGGHSTETNPFGSFNDSGGNTDTGYDSVLTLSFGNGAITLSVQNPTPLTTQPSGTYQSTGGPDGTVYYQTTSSGQLVLTPPQTIVSYAITAGTSFSSNVSNFNTAFVSAWNGYNTVASVTQNNGFSAGYVFPEPIDGNNIVQAASTYNWIPTPSSSPNGASPGVGLAEIFNSISNQSLLPGSAATSNVFQDFINDPFNDSGNPTQATASQIASGSQGALNQNDNVGQPLSIDASPTLFQIYRQTGTNTDPLAALEIPSPYTYVASSTNTSTNNTLNPLGDANSKTRAEINARDQQYIENIRSLRQVVQDEGNQIQANLDTQRQEMSEQADLLSSMIQSWQGIIASIFR